MICPSSSPLRLVEQHTVSFDDSNEWRAVISRADSFMSYFRSGEVKEQIAAANQPRTNSKEGCAEPPPPK